MIGESPYSWRGGWRRGVITISLMLVLLYCYDMLTLNALGDTRECDLQCMGYLTIIAHALLKDSCLLN